MNRETSTRKNTRKQEEKEKVLSKEIDCKFVEAKGNAEENDTGICKVNQKQAKLDGWEERPNWVGKPGPLAKCKGCSQKIKK